MFDSFREAGKIIAALKSTLEHKGKEADSEVLGAMTALQQVFDIAQAVDEQDEMLTPDEISDIGEHGFVLIEDLVYKLAAQKLETAKQDIEQVSLTLAQWVITHHGVLNNIQSVVDGLAYLANALQDKATLAQLADFMGQVAQSCSTLIQHDLDNSNPDRPWRILNINRGIVATRSHDLDVMAGAFADLIQRLPMDAPGFFKEGMSEMVRLNYPEPVRDLMQEFYDRTKLPAVH